mmetsp:Transcript_19989/g.36308  ORF Transcript_19989/g.36308 Transcript_19989/m.36308 type:complete len:96 (-) Transcript_19989:27-314(-)
MIFLNSRISERAEFKREHNKLKIEEETRSLNFALALAQRNPLILEGGGQENQERKTKYQGRKAGFSSNCLGRNVDEAARKRAERERQKETKEKNN